MKKENYSIAPGDKILFVRLNRIGDALVVTPLLAEIKNKTNAEVYILASQTNRIVFDDCPCVSKVIVFEKGLKGFLTLLKLIEQEKFAAIVDLHDDVSTTVSFLVALAKVPLKFGLKKSNSKIYTHTVEKADPTKTHVIERNLALLKLFGLSYNKENVNILYQPREDSFIKADNYLAHKFKEKKFLIGINISAGSEARFWGVERYRQLLSFFKTYDANVLLLSTTRDLKHAIQIATKNEPIFYSPSFDEFAAMISKLNFLFTPDTSTVHLASAFKIPMFGIYVQYNTDDLPWTPCQSKHEIVVTRESNFSNLSFEDVIPKLKPFIETYVKTLSNPVL
ncbi:MAG: glycosyltransferase family 9 protein [Ignavibacteriaceae bacterium]